MLSFRHEILVELFRGDGQLAIELLRTEYPELEIAEVAIDAVAQLPADQARPYLDVIMMALPAAIRQILEARMQHYEYQSAFARKYYGQGREEGREDGLRAAVVARARPLRRRRRSATG